MAEDTGEKPSESDESKGTAGDEASVDRVSIPELEAELVESWASTHKHPPPPPSLRRQNVSVDDDPRFKLGKKPKLVKDLMSRKIFTIEPDTPLSHLEEHMDKMRFTHLPVVEGDKLVGLITRGDLLHASSSFLSAQQVERDRVIHRLPASRIMQRDVVTVGPDDSLAEVAVLMWECGIGCVPVLNEKEQLVGILTEGDFLRAAYYFVTHDSPPSGNAQ